MGPRRASLLHPKGTGWVSETILLGEKKKAMAAERKLPDVATLRGLRNQGWKLKDIAKKYNVSEAAVWKALERAGFTTSKQTYQDILPWEIDPRHRSTAVAQRIRSIMRQKRGITLNPTEQHLLDTWLNAMKENNVVLNYHPDAPANDASRLGGFYYVPREERDAAWPEFIRQPDTKPADKSDSVATEAEEDERVRAVSHLAHFSHP